MDRLGEIRRTGEDDPDYGRAPGGRDLPPRASERERPDAATIPQRSPEVADDVEVFVPPFIGSKVVKGIPLDDVTAFVNTTALYRNQWQFRPETRSDGSVETDAEFKERLLPTFREQLAAARAEDLLVPAVVYGYFPVNADGDDLVVFDDESRTVERMRFRFPRQSESPYLCIADFFRPLIDGVAGTGEPDYAAFHIVTMGAAVSDRAAELFAANAYQDYLLLHGIGVELAEALAEYWHQRIRDEWGFGHEDPDGSRGTPDPPGLVGLFRQKYRGGRYSWGYPACPDLEDNMRVAELLGADRLGITCDEDTGFQYQPEQTTSAIICHHPRAKYFVAR
jgi:5-methyltetrahydrofolate--homocysteine methyltransferase